MSERKDSDELDFIIEAKTFLIRRHKELLKEFRELKHLRVVLEEIGKIHPLDEENQKLLRETIYKIMIMKKIYEMKDMDLKK